MKKHPKRVYVVRRILVMVSAGFFSAAIYGVYQELTTPAYECQQAPVVVMQGDTVYGIAEERCTGNLLEVRHKVVQSYGTVIHAGQVIQLP